MHITCSINVPLVKVPLSRHVVSTLLMVAAPCRSPSQSHFMPVLHKFKHVCVCVSILSIYSKSHLTSSSNFQPSYSQSSNAHLVIIHQLEMYRWFEMSRQSQRSHPIHEIVHFIVKIHSKIPARISRIETDPPDKKHISFQNQLAHDSAGSRIR